eukprot:gene15090-24448_t
MLVALAQFTCAATPPVRYWDLRFTAPTPGTSVEAGKNLTFSVLVQPWWTSDDQGRWSSMGLDAPSDDAPGFPDLTFAQILTARIKVTATVNTEQSFSLQIPEVVVAGEYWLLATEAGTNFEVAGVVPYANIDPIVHFGSKTITVEEAVVAECAKAADPHGACGEHEYCDNTGTCFDCAWYQQTLDAFEGICPEKCGGSCSLSIGSRIPDKDEVDASGAVQDVIGPGCPSYEQLAKNVNPAIVFAESSKDSEPRRMTRRLAEKLNELAELVASMPEVYGVGAVVHVTKSYMQHTYGDDPTLHTEGRALVIHLESTGDLSHAEWNGCAFNDATCECVGWVRYGTNNAYSAAQWSSSSLVCSTSIFGDPIVGSNIEACECATNVGTSSGTPTAAPDATEVESNLVLLAQHAAGVVRFDWVGVDTPSELHLSVSTDDCKTPVDLMFLLDESGSIDVPDYGGTPGNYKNKVVAFVKSVMPLFDFGDTSEHSRIGLASFSSNSRIHFRPGQYSTLSDLDAALDAVGDTYEGRNTHTSDALQMVRTDLMKEAEAITHELGSCVRANGSDITTGVLANFASAGDMPEPQCFEWCLTIPGASGCEWINPPSLVADTNGNFPQNCFVHTDPYVAKGSGGPEDRTCRVITNAHGLRPLSEGIARVLIIITDGKATEGYESATEASLIRNDNVNIFAMGVGQGIERRELEGMASDPTENHVFALKSFSQMTNVVASVSASACSSASIVNTGEQTNTFVDNCEIKYFTPACGNLQSTIVTVKSISGDVEVYLSSKTDTPGPHAYEMMDNSSSSTKTLVYERNDNSSGSLIVAVKGTADPKSKFTLDTWSDMFGGIGAKTLHVSEGVAAQPLCPPLGWDCTWPASSQSPCCRSGQTGSSSFYCNFGIDARESNCCPNNVGADVYICTNAKRGTALNFSAADQISAKHPYTPTFSISTGAEMGLFHVDDTSGELFLTGNLDYETTTEHTIRIESRDEGRACLSGYFDVVISVENVNDNHPDIIPPGNTTCTDVACLGISDNWIEGDPYTITLHESVPVGSKLFTIDSIDKDGNGVQFKLAGKSDSRRAETSDFPFTIDAITGAISTTGIFDAQTKSIYDAIIIAEDDGAPKLTTFQPLKVIIETVPCAVGTFSADGSFPCAAVSTCDASSEYELSTPTLKSDRICRTTTPCTQGMTYMTAAPTAIKDRECSLVSQCGTNEYESKAPTWTNDRECQTYTQCSANQYESVARTSFSDRRCDTVNECNYDAQYESQAPTSTSGRVCVDLTVCTSDEYETLAATKAADRKCVPISSCNSGKGGFCAG